MISLCWLIFCFAFFLGLYVYHAQIWPYKPLMEIRNFIVGHAEENLSLREKIENDLNLKPNRHLKVADIKDGKWLQKGDTFESEKHTELTGLNLNPRRQNPLIMLAENAPEGYRLIQGTFDFDKALHGAILLDPEGKVLRTWHLSQNGIQWEHQKDTNIFPHGMEIAPDGSIVTSFDEGNSLTKYDFCGKIVWRTEGLFHHSISFEDENTLWAWERKAFTPYDTAEQLAKVDYNTGKVIKRIFVKEVMDANPDIDIFSSVQNDTPYGSTWAALASGFWHVNDIEPLTKAFESHYPGFQAGDLLVSLRTPNLIFIMDQNTLKVKWWRQGLTRRQHDPDWNHPAGDITIFNNNMHRGFSTIVQIDPVTYAHDILIDGEDYNFYTWWRGKHQRLPNGGFIITSADQGRVFETDKEGNITFEMINAYKHKEAYLVLSEARFLPKDFFKDLPQCDP